MLLIWSSYLPTGLEIFSNLLFSYLLLVDGLLDFPEEKKQKKHCYSSEKPIQKYPKEGRPKIHIRKICANPMSSQAKANQNQNKIVNAV